MRSILATLLCLGAVAYVQASAVPVHRQVRRQEGPVPPDTIEACIHIYDSQPGDTCASIARDWGISELQFTTYNPSAKSDCSGLIVGSAYSVEGNYGNGPPPPKPTSSTSVTSSQTTTTSTSPTATGPTPVQRGITTQCQQYYKIQDGDTCADIVNIYHTFTLQDFYLWNPSVGSNRETLFVGYYLCTGIPGTPTAPPTTTSAGATPGPSPTQSGLITTCKTFYKVVDGDYCEKIVSSYETFSVADSYTWNPAIGTRYYHAVSGDSCEVIPSKFGTFTVTQFQSWNPVGLDCGQLFLGYYYYIAVPGTPTTRSTTSTTQTTSATSSGPSPTQTGIIATCTKYYKTVSGDSCQAIWDRLGTFCVTQFISWNPAVQSDCSQLYLGYCYCIAIPGTPTTRTTTSITSKAPTPTPTGPQPQQPGIVANCNM
ncbi:MAG: hypothetical protein Q9207_004108 [Kuettlingeria erythrocarpa]